jgi:hypothetical protein
MKRPNPGPKPKREPKPGENPPKEPPGKERPTRNLLELPRKELINPGNTRRRKPRQQLPSIGVFPKAKVTNFLRQGGQAHEI